jgi:hypothetical protein
MVAKKVDNDLDFQGFKIINGKQEGFTGAATTITSALTLTTAHHTIILNAATASTIVPVTLPDPTTCIGRIYRFASRRGILSLLATGSSTIFDGIATLTTVAHGRQADLVSDGTNWRSLTSTVPNNPTTRPQELFTDFHTVTNTTTLDFVHVTSGTGAGVASGASSQPNRVGIIELTTGSTATGKIHVGDRSGGNPFFLGAGATTFAAAVELKALSSATDRYQATIGFYDNVTGTLQQDAVMFLYDEGGVTTGSTASPNWQRVVSSNNVRTFTVTTVPAKIGWVNFRIEVNGDGTNAEFFIDGVSVGSFTTGVPTGATRATGFGVAVYKSVGITPVLAHVDWMCIKSDFSSNPRGVW